MLIAKETYLNENEVQVIVEKDDGTGSQMTDADDVESNKSELVVDMIETPTDTNLENLQQEKEKMTVWNLSIGIFFLSYFSFILFIL